MNHQNIPNLSQIQSSSKDSQNSSDSDVTIPNLLEEPSGSLEFQMHSRHRDQRMRMEEQDFDLQEFVERKFEGGHVFDQFPGHVSYSGKKLDEKKAV